MTKVHMSEILLSVVLLIILSDRTTVFANSTTTGANVSATINTIISNTVDNSTSPTFDATASANAPLENEKVAEWPQNPGTAEQRQGLTQTEATKDCIAFMWSSFQRAPQKLQLQMLNTLIDNTIEKDIPLTDTTYKVCGLDEHQRYKVRLFSTPAPAPDQTQPPVVEKELMESYMWTLQDIPNSPPEPHITDEGVKSITILVFEMDFDEEKGPFSGFDIRIIKTSELGKQRRRRDTRSHGIPPGVSVGFLKSNKDQEFEIGGSDNARNRPLKSDTDYTISVGAVSHLLGVTTHSYVTLQATTTSINIHVITMFILLILGLALLLGSFLYLRWKKEKREEDAKRVEREGMMLYLGKDIKEEEEEKEEEGQDSNREEEEDDKADEKGRGDGRVVGVLGSPELVASYVQMRHPWLTAHNEKAENRGGADEKEDLKTNVQRKEARPSTRS